MSPALALVVGCLLAGAGAITEVDGRCEAQEQCIHRDQCDVFAGAATFFRNLAPNSAQKNQCLTELKESTCNNAERGVCCKPSGSCKDGLECVPQNDCQSFSELRSRLKKFAPGTSDHANLLGQLKAKVCDSKARTVCCESLRFASCSPGGGPAPPQPGGGGPAPPRPSTGCSPAEGDCLPSSAKCGASGSVQRIVGGVDAIPGEFPFTALLGRVSVTKHQTFGDIKKNIWKCGGTLINQRYVVTAAHCHSPRIEKKQISIVRLGEYQVTEQFGGGPPPQDCVDPRDLKTCLAVPQDFLIDPADVTLHPDYTIESDRTVSNDIALIRLPRTAELNYGTNVVCLPLNPSLAARQLNVPDLREGLTGYRPYVVGWGYTEGDPNKQTTTGTNNKVATDRQQKLHVPVLSSEVCGQKFSSGWTPKSTQICAGGEKGKDSCNGDSGGPLYLKYIIPGQKVPDANAVDEEKPWYLLGIVSFGTSHCATGSPGVYTRVEEFIPWIQSVIKK